MALQVFFLVITFGLYHGLVFFPVLLSLLGPRSYKLKEARPETQEKEKPESSSSTSF
jgi:hypothetical protein